MRVPRFRVWDKINQKWVNACNFYIDIMQHISAVVDIDGEMYGLHQVDIMQYTGLKDKNGKEIWEGDILKTNKGIMCIVYWSVSGACFMIKYPNIWSTKIGWYIYKTLRQFKDKAEVIGNLYENPELIGGQ